MSGLITPLVLAFSSLPAASRHHTRTHSVTCPKEIRARSCWSRGSALVPKPRSRSRSRSRSGSRAVPAIPADRALLERAAFMQLLVGEPAAFAALFCRAGTQSCLTCIIRAGNPRADSCRYKKEWIWSHIITKEAFQWYFRLNSTN